MSAPWLNVRQVAERICVTRGTVYKILDRDSDFPRPVYPTPKSPRWKAAAVDAWMESRAAPEAAA